MLFPRTDSAVEGLEVSKALRRWVAADGPRSSSYRDAKLTERIISILHRGIGGSPHMAKVSPAEG